jgi:hypothetical protein
MIWLRGAPALLILTLGACVDSADPAAGGLSNAVVGLAGGGYDERIDERESGVAVAQAQGEALDAQLAALQGQHLALKDRIIQQRAALRAGGVRLSPDSEGKIQTVLLSSPSQSDPNVRAAALQRAIADARALSEQLAALSS